MSETNGKKFMGTYFDRDAVLRLARLTTVFAWITLGFYILQALVSLLVLALQVARGLIAPGGLTDILQQFLWAFQPALPGLWYFIGLQAIGKVLLIFMDMEDNTRRAARK